MIDFVGRPPIRENRITCRHGNHAFSNSPNKFLLIQIFSGVV